MFDRILSPTQAAPWGATSIRRLATHDGEAFTASLTHRGVAVAAIENGGTGGPTQIRWNGLRYDGSPMSEIAPALKKSMGSVQAAHGAWFELLASLPLVPFHGKDLKVSSDWLAEEVVEIVELKKRCLKKLCFTTKGKEYALNGPDNAEARAWLVRKHPDAVILNDLWGPSVAPAAPAAPVAPVAPARVPPTLAQLMRGEVGS